MISIGILETGRPPPDLIGRFGSYGAMFERLLGPGFTLSCYDVQRGEYSPDVDSHRGYVVTGSPAGVYEAHPWIAVLKEWLRQAKGRAKLVGICFGHQIMAEAFGGRVEKSERGWGIGLHSYEVAVFEPWMDSAAPFAIPVSHQDQVVAMPPQARVVAGSPFSPNGVLAYDGGAALSFQCHPEFDPEFAKALIESRRDRLREADAALASLDKSNDCARVAGWIRTFLAQS